MSSLMDLLRRENLVLLAEELMIGIVILHLLIIVSLALWLLLKLGRDIWSGGKPASAQKDRRS